MNRPAPLFLSLCALLACGAPDTESDCSDGADNDRDGKFDCDDPDCRAACDGTTTGGPTPGTPTGSTTGTPTGTVSAETFVYVDIPLSGGDLDCWSPAEAWITHTPQTPPGGLASITVETIDFQEQVPVPQTTLEVWHDGVATGAPDGSWTTDNGGLAAVQIPACIPMTARMTTDPNLIATKTTYQVDRLFPASGSTAVPIVSDTTYRLIPTIFGVTIDPDKAILGGRVVDCAGTPVANAQAVARVDGAVPDTLGVNYFTEGFPDRDRQWTSADGLFVMTNLPPGEILVEVWGVDGSLVQIAENTVIAEADAFTLFDTPYGTADGVTPGVCP